MRPYLQPPHNDGVLVVKPRCKFLRLNRPQILSDRPFDRHHLPFAAVLRNAYKARPSHVPGSVLLYFSFDDVAFHCQLMQLGEAFLSEYFQVDFPV